MNQADIGSRVSKEEKDSRSQLRLDSRHLESRLMRTGIDSWLKKDRATSSNFE
jgi:hypothetical protein